MCDILKSRSRHCLALVNTRLLRGIINYREDRNFKTMEGGYDALLEQYSHQQTGMKEHNKHPVPSIHLKNDTERKKLVSP